MNGSRDPSDAAADQDATSEPGEAALGVAASAGPATAARFTSNRCTLLERNRKAFVVALAVALACVPLAVALAVREPQLLALPILGLVVSLVAANSIWTYRYLSIRREGRLEASARGIAFDGKLRFSRDRLARPLLVGGGSEPPRLVLFSPDAQWIGEIEVPTEQQAAALVAAATLDAASAVGSFRLTSHWFGKTWVFIALGWLPLCIGTIAWLTSAHFGRSLGLVEGSIAQVVAFWLVVVVFVAGLLWLHRRSKLQVRIGPDGVSLRGLGREQFVRHRDVARVEPWQGQRTRHGVAASEGVDLVLYGGGRIRLRTQAQMMTYGRMRLDVVADQLETALRHGRSPRTAPLELPELRHTHVGSWIDGLRRMGVAGGSGYRAGALPADLLWAKLGDPGAEPAERAASAILLCASQEAGARERVGAQARAIAHPALRAVVDAAARGEGDELLAAVARLAES